MTSSEPATSVQVRSVPAPGAPAAHAPTAPAAPAPGSQPTDPDPAPGVVDPATVDPTVPWGMQIAVRYDKVHPPRRVDVAEAVGRAVVALLASPQAAPGGPWHAAVSYWRDRRIRKLVRRARGRRWEEVQRLAGVTVAQDGPRGWGQAAARAIVPGPVRPLPPEIAKTQVEGTHFPHGQELPPAPAAVRAVVEQAVAQERADAVGRLHGPGTQPPGAPGVRPRGDARGSSCSPPTAPPPDRPRGDARGDDDSQEDVIARYITLGAESASTDALVTVEVTPLHEMTSGKLCAQVAHAAQLAWQSPDLPDRVRRAWARDGYRLRVTFPDRASWEAASGRRPVSVVDAGFTELDGPTETTRALW